MLRRSAIHCKFILVSCRNRRAILSFYGSPFPWRARSSALPPAGLEFPGKDLNRPGLVGLLAQLSAPCSERRLSEALWSRKYALMREPFTESFRAIDEAGLAGAHRVAPCADFIQVRALHVRVGLARETGEKCFHQQSPSADRQTERFLYHHFDRNSHAAKLRLRCVKIKASCMEGFQSAGPVRIQKPPGTRAPSRIAFGWVSETSRPLWTGFGASEGE